MSHLRRLRQPGLVGFGLVCIVAVCAGLSRVGADTAMQGALPGKLSETGLYVAGTMRIGPDKLPYTPQYPLWSDGAAKRRWLYLPPGSSIDAANPDVWRFPPGTRLWKEFGYAKPVETRLIERLADGSWRFSAYVWDEGGRDARLAPPEGIPRLPVADAPGGVYAIPSRDDCRACHEAAAEPVLGIGVLQLSSDRDALAPHAETAGERDVDMLGLHERGLLRNLPSRFLAAKPRIPAPSPEARATLGYLHANCGHCHNDHGPLADLDLNLQYSVAGGAESVARILETLVGYPSELPLQHLDLRLMPGAADASVLPARMRSRNPLLQMPPLGTRLSDEEANSLVAHWIEHDLQPKEDYRNENPR